MLRANVELTTAQNKQCFLSDCPEKGIGMYIVHTYITRADRE